MSKKFDIHEWQAKLRLENYGVDSENKIDTKKYGPEVLQAMYDLKNIINIYADFHHYQTYGFDYNTLKKILDDALQNVSGGSMSDEEAEERTRLGIDEMEEHHDTPDPEKQAIWDKWKSKSAYDLIDFLKPNTDLYNAVEKWIENPNDKEGSPEWWKNLWRPDLSEENMDENSLGGAGAGAEFKTGGMAHLGKKKKK